ncbi:MAG: hypothetical protein ACLRTD_10390, partial [Bacteroides sp.]
VQESANLLLASTVSQFAVDQSFYRYGYSTAVNNSLFQQNDNVVNGVWAYRAEAYNVSSEALTMMKWKPYLKSDGVNSNSGIYYVMDRFSPLTRWCATASSFGYGRTLR